MSMTIIKNAQAGTIKAMMPDQNASSVMNKKRYKRHLRFLTHEFAYVKD